MRNLLKAAAKTGSGTLATLLLGAVAMKVTAMVVGPSGVGVFSLLRQTQQTASIAGSFGGQTPLVQALASRDMEGRSSYVAAVFTYFVLASAAMVAVLALASPWLGPAILGAEVPHASALIALTALPSLAGVAVAFFSGVLNGHRALGRLALVQVVAAGLLAILAYPVARFAVDGQRGAFIVLLLVPLAGSAVYAASVAYRNHWLPRLRVSLRALRGSESSRHFLPYASTTLVVNLLGTGAVLTVRTLVRTRQGLGGAGVFDVAWTFSMMYVMIVLNSLATYYLPTLSATSERGERIALIRQLVRFAVMAMVPLICGVIALRPLIISLLYSPAFLPALRTMRWMLLGDYLKVTGWILAMPMLAFPNMRAFFWSEIIGNCSFLALTYLGLVFFHDVGGVGIAFFLNHVLYLAFTYWYSSSRHGFAPTRALALTWLGGFVLLAAFSAWSWNADKVDAPFAALAITSSCLFGWLVLPASERRAVMGRVARLFARGART